MTLALNMGVRAISCSRGVNSSPPVQPLPSGAYFPYLTFTPSCSKCPSCWPLHQVQNRPVCALGSGHAFHKRESPVMSDTVYPSRWPFLLSASCRSMAAMMDEAVTPRASAILKTMFKLGCFSPFSSRPMCDREISRIDARSCWDILLEWRIFLSTCPKFLCMKRVWQLDNFFSATYRSPRGDFEWYRSRYINNLICIYEFWLCDCFRMYALATSLATISTMLQWK